MSQNSFRISFTKKHSFAFCNVKFFIGIELKKSHGLVCSFSTFYIYFICEHKNIITLSFAFAAIYTKICMKTFNCPQKTIHKIKFNENFIHCKF